MFLAREWGGVMGRSGVGRGHEIILILIQISFHVEQSAFAESNNKIHSTLIILT